MDHLESWLRGGHGLAGVELTDEEVAVLRVVHGAYSPMLGALDAVDLRDLPIEGDLDPSRPPQAR